MLHHLRGLLTHQRITAVTAASDEGEALARRLAEACALTYVPRCAEYPVPVRLLLVDITCRSADALSAASQALVAAGAESVLPFVLCDLRM